MAEKGEQPSLKIVPKASPEKKTEAIVKTFEKKGLELPHIEGRKKLTDVQGKLKGTREKVKALQDEEDNAEKNLKLIDNDRPGKLEPATQTKELKDLKESLKKEEGDYQATFDKTLEAEKNFINSSGDDKKKEATATIEKEYIEKYSSDMVLSEKPLDQKCVGYLADKFPSAWKETLLNPESTKNPELLQVRKKMFEKIALDASAITRTKSDTDESYSEKLRQNFIKNTGVDIKKEEFDILVGKEKEQRKTEAEKREEKENVLPKKEGESDKDFQERSSQETPQDYSSRTGEPLKNIGPDEKGASIGYNEKTEMPTGKPKEEADKIKIKLKEKNPELDQNLAQYIDRHAANDPNFSANQPFLMQDVRSARAYICYPNEDKITQCSATHGSKGVGNTEGSHGTSLGSKRLAPASDGSRNGNSIQIRTDVHGLEACNKTDYSRDIRIHEQHGAATHGCTGLPMSEMRKFDAAIDSAGGGAQEVFLGINQQTTQLA